MKLKIYLLLTVLIFTVACGGDPQKPSPEMSRDMLKLRGYQMDEPSFFRAIKQNDLIALNTFLDAGMNPNAKNERGETALTFAIENTDFKTVKILAQKADLSLRDDRSQSPVHLALSKGKDDIFIFLVDQKADVNVPGSKGTLKEQTALYLAVTRGREDFVDKLLERGADPNIADSEGGLPLAEAVIGSPINSAIVRRLLKHGAKVNHQEKNGATPLIYIASNNNTDPETRQEIVRMLLEHGADKTIKDVKGNTALDWAKKNGNKDVEEMLKN